MILPKKLGVMIPVAQDTEYELGFTYVFEMSRASLSNNIFSVQLLSERTRSTHNCLITGPLGEF